LHLVVTRKKTRGEEREKFSVTKLIDQLAASFRASLHRNKRRKTEKWKNAWNNNPYRRRRRRRIGTNHIASRKEEKKATFFLALWRIA